MVRFVYTSWDGSQKGELDADETFDQLAAYLSETDDLAEALDRLLRNGYGGREFEAAGLDELLARVAEAIREFSNGYDLDCAEDIAARVAALRVLEARLFERDLEAIDLDEAAELLGSDAAAAIARLREMITALVDAGYVVPKEGRLVLSSKGARRFGRLALEELHSSLLYDASGYHKSVRRGAADLDLAQSKPYVYGDLFQLDVSTTVANAVHRSASLPIEIEPADFEVYDANRNTRSATVLLLDMSWSMSWEGRFAAAKKVALAMEALMRARFPHDYFGIVGFYTRAVELELADLPEVTWNMGDPFTNLQDGLRLGAELLRRQAGRNKNLIVITDGQPTAYFRSGKLYCEWPTNFGGLSTRATVETLNQVKRVTRQDIRINTFMLDDNPLLRSFVDQMTAINKGRAFYTTPRDLGRFLLVDYVGRRRKVI